MYLFWLYVDIIYFVNDASCCFIFLNNYTENMHSLVLQRTSLLLHNHFYTVLYGEQFYLPCSTKYNIWNLWQVDKQNYSELSEISIFAQLSIAVRWPKINVDCILLNIINVILNHFNVQLTKYLGTLLYMHIGLINITSEYLKGEMHENVLVANVK